MHIFTTSSCVWLRQGVAEALAEDGGLTRVTAVSSLSSPDAAGLLEANGTEKRLILLTFPPRRPTVCLRSVIFLLEWLKVRQHIRGRRAYPLHPLGKQSARRDVRRSADRHRTARHPLACDASPVTSASSPVRRQKTASHAPGVEPADASGGDGPSLRP
ncbi:Uncharacterised protein [Salmonella enterica subsp. salamae]|nr:Uncharacterised protein [Salmonella enterica subsp. salamae]